MADLAISLPVFIASPSDVSEERDSVERAVYAMSRAAAAQGILLTPFRWEKDARPGFGRPQDLLEPALRRAELVVVIFWSKLGSPASVDGVETGTMEELRLAKELVRRGQSDDVFVYFRTSAPPASTSESAAESVRRLREMLDAEKAMMYWTYTTADDLTEKFESHLASWLFRWQRIPQICRYTLNQSAPYKLPAKFRPENLHHMAASIFDPLAETRLADVLGRAAVELYQEQGFSGASEAVPLDCDQMTGDRLKDYIYKARAYDCFDQYTEIYAQRGLHPRPLVARDNGEIYFADKEWFSFFCAQGLFRAILNDDRSAVSTIPYGNDIHQYLAGQVQAVPEDEAQAVESALMKWLSGAKGEPIVRNFAAYVLGMIGAVRAEDALADAVKNDDGLDVRMYSISSLGKIRSRKYLYLLVDEYERESDTEMRVMIGQSICRITGLANYEL